ncbi:hypothetical protein DENSPDRAFT_934428 [Dentipellis sp. KUC8613]|nr:hypothetical protein DENSPDRAFT_934428 [Dentipellis sp. KUC8613]
MFHSCTPLSTVARRYAPCLAHPRRHPPSLLRRSHCRVFPHRPPSPTAARRIVRVCAVSRRPRLPIESRALWLLLATLSRCAAPRLRPRALHGAVSPLVAPTRHPLAPRRGAMRPIAASRPPRCPLAPHRVIIRPAALSCAPLRPLEQRRRPLSRLWRRLVTLPCLGVAVTSRGSPPLPRAAATRASGAISRPCVITMPSPRHRPSP